MGQYHIPVNLDKREFIHPHKLATGLKLWEFLGASAGSVTDALVALLAVSTGRGGGDITPDEIVGRWGGDRVAIVGDYAEDDDLKDSPIPASEIYGLCVSPEDRDGDWQPDEWGRDFTDITDHVCAYLEKLYEGKYCGDGWRHFYYPGMTVWKWAEGERHERIPGTVKKIGNKKITFEWPDGETSYPFDKMPYIAEGA